MKTILHVTGTALSTALLVTLLFCLLAWFTILPSAGLLWLAGAL